MTGATRTHIVRIGNSRGVRIPKLWLEQLQFGEEVEMTVQANQLLIRSAHRPRQDWEASFAEMRRRGDDRLTDDMPSSAWDAQHWEW